MAGDGVTYVREGDEGDILRFEPGSFWERFASFAAVTLAIILCLLLLRGGCEATRGRAGIWTQSYTAPLPYQVTTRKSAKLAEGVRVVLRPGRVGLRSVGEVVVGSPRGDQRVLFRAATTLRKPRDELVVQGTKVVVARLAGKPVTVRAAWRPNSVDVDHVGVFSRYAGNLVAVDLVFEGPGARAAWRDGLFGTRVCLRSRVSREEFECLYARPLRDEEWRAVGALADGAAAREALAVRFIFDLLSEGAFDMKNPHVRGFRDLELVFRQPGRWPRGGREIARVGLEAFDPVNAR